MFPLKHAWRNRRFDDANLIVSQNHLPRFRRYFHDILRIDASPIVIKGTNTRSSRCGQIVADNYYAGSDLVAGYRGFRVHTHGRQNHDSEEIRSGALIVQPRDIRRYAASGRMRTRTS